MEKNHFQGLFLFVWIKIISRKFVLVPEYLYFRNEELIGFWAFQLEDIRQSYVYGMNEQFFYKISLCGPRAKDISVIQLMLNQNKKKTKKKTRFNKVTFVYKKLPKLNLKIYKLHKCIFFYQIKILLYEIRYI